MLTDRIYKYATAEGKALQGVTTRHAPQEFKHLLWNGATERERKQERKTFMVYFGKSGDRNKQTET